MTRIVTSMPTLLRSTLMDEFLHITERISSIKTLLKLNNVALARPHANTNENTTAQEEQKEERFVPSNNTTSTSNYNSQSTASSAIPPASSASNSIFDPLLGVFAASSSSTTTTHKVPTSAKAKLNYTDEDTVQDKGDINLPAGEEEAALPMVSTLFCYCVFII